MLAFRTSTSLPSVKKEFTDDWSLQFDGVDDTVVLQDAFNQTIHSVSFWVKVGNGSGNRAIFDGRDANNDGILIFAVTNDKINYKISDQANLSQTTADTTNWQHIVCTYDGETQSIYVNGELDASQTVTTVLDVSNPATIGSKSFGSGAYWLGNIDDLALFDVALNQDQVTVIWNSGEPAQLNCNHEAYTRAASLKGYYMFENEGGDTAIINDYSPLNNYGTRSGAVFRDDTP